MHPPAKIEYRFCDNITPVTNPFKCLKSILDACNRHPRFVHSLMVQSSALGCSPCWAHSRGPIYVPVRIVPHISHISRSIMERKRSRLATHRGCCTFPLSNGCLRPIKWCELTPPHREDLARTITICLLSSSASVLVPDLSFLRLRPGASSFTREGQEAGDTPARLNAVLNSAKSCLLILCGHLASHLKEAYRLLTEKYSARLRVGRLLKVDDISLDFARLPVADGPADAVFASLMIQD